jgi:maltose O-acetyltransferase
LSDYPLRILHAFLASELVPASLRTKLMRASGFPMSRRATIWAGANLRSKKIKIGDEVFINVGFYHDGYAMLEIGNHIKIGPFVHVVTAAHEVGPSGQRGLVEVTGKPVSIGDGCWIGASVTILPGANIAPGCIVTAGAVVYEPTEPDGLYAGNPARRVRELEP